MRTAVLPRLGLWLMSRRSLSASSSPPRDIKRPRIAGLTPDDYRNGVMLAPMVRSGARTSPKLSNIPLLRFLYLQFLQDFLLSNMAQS